ncbi:DUF2500 domain-containing protein [Paenibacillus sp. YPG26]|uniref:DUF2500 domain-containing protein n=1 Tax=Paenibacillus sp. YPG26 TaxID=2878915 RepID=UPI00203FD947|nr:DUF2500 domain-containing protein [Paenibacillus sp. YPG26]USB34041.1 DUF2500 domain-containing protein [Paenibacillus sp. YPG26]
MDNTFRFGPDVWLEFLDGVPLWSKIFGGTLLVVMIGTFAYAIIKGLMVWSANNSKSMLTKQAVVVSKRTEVWEGVGNTAPSTNYYITFELENGARMEFQMAAREFGLLVEKDEGEITYQGGRFMNFNRRMKGKYTQYV